jgi:molybdate transport system ATP-binding protein
MSEPASLLRVELDRPGFSLALEIAWDERVLVLFGPSGSGKTSLLECVLGLHPEARSRIRLAGEWLEDAGSGLRVPDHARRLGWVPQGATLFPHLDVAENLRFGQRRAGPDGAAVLARATEVLEIGSLLRRRVGELSGGERSRVALARAIASGARVLLLDEPLASLDLPLRARVLPYLLRVRDELGLPMLYITHDPDEAMLLGERVAVLEAGRLVAHGPPRDVLWSRAVLHLSEALGLENVLEARTLDTDDAASGGLVESAAGLRLAVPWRLPPDSPVCVGIRAEDLMLALHEPRDISARNVLAARVVSCERRDGDYLVHLDAGERWVAKLTSGAVEKLGLREGLQVFVIIKAHALRRLR